MQELETFLSDDSQLTKFYFYIFFLRRRTKHPCQSSSTKQYSESCLRALALYSTVDDPSNVLESSTTRKKN